MVGSADPPPNLMHPLRFASSRSQQIWAVGGGKGGIGKSLLASSLAIILSKMGYKTIAIDLDLGGANLHTALGVGSPKYTLNDYLTQRIPNIQDCLNPSELSNLSLISGAHDAIGVTNLRNSQKNHLLNAIKQLDADYIIFDLGAGTSYNTLDFFLFSHVGLIALLPEPTSIENAYRFIKSIYFRYLSHSAHLAELQSLIHLAMDPKNSYGIQSPADLVREANKISKNTSLKLKKEISNFKLNIILNQVRTQTDIDIGSSVKTICKKYFGIEMNYLGYLEYDSSVWQAFRKKRPLMMEFPNSKIAIHLEKIAQSILSQQSSHEAAKRFSLP